MDILQRDRKYVLTIGDYKTGDGIQITDLQVRFDASKSADNKRTGNSATIEVYNLSRATLGRLETEFLEATLAVGYAATGVQTIVTGNVTHTTTVKQGTDTVTQLQLGEGYVALNHKRLKSLVAPGQSVQDVVEEIRKQMPGVVRGAYVGTNLSNKVLYGYPLNGTPRAMLDRLCKEMRLEWRVDNGALYITHENGLLSKDTTSVPRIDVDSGLIDIPFYAAGDSKLPTNKQHKAGVQFKMLLNPEIIPGKMVYLVSSVMPNMTGFYRVNDVRHTGDFRGTDWYTEVTASRVESVELA